jgi:ABC-2 type transport system ATP-binding protein
VVPLGGRLCHGLLLDHPQSLQEAPVPAVEMHAVSKSYRRRGRPPQKALDDLHLLVESGGVHGFLGPNGSGKTTTIQVLLGLVRADAGDVRLRTGRSPPACPR